MPVVESFVCWENGTTEGAVFATSPRYPPLRRPATPSLPQYRTASMDRSALLPRPPFLGRIPVGAGACDGQPRCAVAGGRASLERARRLRLGGELHAGQRLRDTSWACGFPTGRATRSVTPTLFATIFRDSTLQTEVLHIRFTDPAAAVAEVLFRLVGYEALPPDIGEPRPSCWRPGWWTCCRRSTATGGSSSARTRRSYRGNGEASVSDSRRER